MMDTQSSQSLDWRSRRLRLPLITAGLIAAAVVTISAIAYFAMRDVPVPAAGEHLLIVSREISATFGAAEQKLERENARRA